MRFTPLQDGCLITLKNNAEAATGGVIKNAVLKNFTIFTGKHMC